MKSKKKGIIMSCIIGVMALSLCSVGVLAMDPGEKTDDILNDPEYCNALNEGRLPTEIKYSNEEKQQMIEKRKADKIKYGTKTELEIAKEEGREEEYWKAKADEEEFCSTEEGKKWKAEIDKMYAEQDIIANGQKNAAILLVSNAGYYKDGLDPARIDYDEDYMLDFVITVCKSYSECKKELTSSEITTIESYLNDMYNTITGWFPQSEKSMDAYEMIEKTIEVQYYSTSVERR